jgi:cytochrome c-type biogenesis protein CcmF
VSAFGSLVARNRRRYGGYVVHVAVVLLAIGIAGSSAYQSVAEGDLRPGDRLEVGGYTFVYRGLSQEARANHIALRAQGDVYRGGHYLGPIRPGKNEYVAEQQQSNEMAIRSDYLRAEDFLVIADRIKPDGTVFFRALVKPLVNLIWLAGLVFLLGSLIALWPDAREQRRLEARYEGALAEA